MAKQRMRYERLAPKNQPDRLEAAAPRGGENEPGPEARKQLARAERERLAEFQSKHAKWFPSWATRRGRA